MASLKQIRYFLTTADLGSLTQAAATLFVAQPALSRQIASLEKELGFALFVREARGVSLTPAGEVYRRRVLAVDQLLAAAAEESSQFARGEAGVLRLLHSSSIPADSLLPAIRQFLTDCPGARIELDRISSEQQISELAAGKADLGIVRLPLLRQSPDVHLVELPIERLWVALPTDNPLAPQKTLMLDDLRQEPFVSAVHRERGGLARLVTELCLRRGIIPKTARVMSRKTSMLNLVAAGLGIAVVPERMIGMRLDGLCYRPLGDLDAEARSALALPGVATALARRFAEIMQAAGKATAT